MAGQCTRNATARTAYGQTEKKAQNAQNDAKSAKKFGIGPGFFLRSSRLFAPFASSVRFSGSTKPPGI